MENILFDIRKVKIKFLDKEIINIDHLAVHQFDRIGIVGKNGAGKSTLLRLLSGEIEPNSGKINRYTKPGIFKQMENPTEKNADGMLLSKLGISSIGENASGGEQTKLKLAELFSTYYEALLIDEPTTHLDQDGISFIIEQLKHYYGALLLISHDRNLLDELVDTIWEVSDLEVKIYSGNYTAYEAQKKLEIRQQKEAHENYIREKERLEKAVEEKLQKASSMLGNDNKSKQKAKEKPSRLGKSKSKGTSQKGIYRAAKSIEQRIDNLEDVAAIKVENEIVFHQSKALALHNKFPIMAENLSLSVGNKLLLDHVNFQFPLGKKIAITGPNGSGKSTLLHHIQKGGDGLSLSPKVKFGFYDQMSYQFISDETIIQYMRKKFDQPEGFLRSVLHRMLFTGTDLKKQLNNLSGGEIIRLKLCELFLGEYNILLLDEPTNFLDIHALEALEQFILGYEGTVIFISHDKTFINHTADIVFKIDPENKTIYQI
ncbi:Msr family ABC-F type ribosomal protection protein [Oceanobacillus sp. CAU 1775]